ncbi:IclR family transcriptional regulator [Sciscionella sediminilitoris]|uniref:IclR family transcriptional regulator n=1 Tax=Sciscionella sediminilitoris TaxID=1445613 RepID=UPI00068F10F4|nr:IclR family transcriptional regulator [Sciscionella sp. SE31]
MTTMDKTFLILEKVAANGPRLPLARLQELTEIPKPTLYRMLRTMVEHGLVHNDGSGTYRAGRRLFALAGMAYRQVSVPPETRRIMIELQERVPETVHVSVFRHRQLFYVEKLDAPHPYQMASQVGKSQAVHSSAIGKAVLAQLPAEEAEQLLSEVDLPAITETTIVDRAQLIGALPAIRGDGYALDDEEDEAGLRAIGSAVADETGYPVGGISLVAPSFRMSAAQACEYAPALRTAADRIQDCWAAHSPGG